LINTFVSRKLKLSKQTTTTLHTLGHVQAYDTKLKTKLPTCK